MTKKCAKRRPKKNNVVVLNKGSDMLELALWLLDACLVFGMLYLVFSEGPCKRTFNALFGESILITLIGVVALVAFDVMVIRMDMWLLAISITLNGFVMIGLSVQAHQHHLRKSQPWKEPQSS